MASAAERADALGPHLDEARRQVDDLAARLEAATRRRHDALVAADVAAGNEAHREAAELRAALDAALARRESFETAAAAVAKEKHREYLESQLERVNSALAEAVASARRQVAEVRPALSAAKLALRQAQASEDLARQFEVERNELEIHLGMRERGKFSANTNAVRALIESHGYLLDLLRNPEV